MRGSVVASIAVTSPQPAVESNIIITESDLLTIGWWNGDHDLALLFSLNCSCQLQVVTPIVIGFKINSVALARAIFIRIYNLHVWRGFWKWFEFFIDNLFKWEAINFTFIKLHWERFIPLKFWIHRLFLLTFLLRIHEYICCRWLRVPLKHIWMIFSIAEVEQYNEVPFSNDYYYYCPVHGAVAL